MGLEYANLDATTREYMLREIAWDMENGGLYESRRLTGLGRSRWPSLLKEAAEQYSDDWLAERLKAEGLIKTKETRKTKSRIIEVEVPFTAPETLSEGEFNRFYIRGLCCRAIDSRIPNLVVYRAKQVQSPRASSQAIMGTMIDAQSLLNDLRTHQGEEPSLKMPGGPNSGLSMRMP